MYIEKTTAEERAIIRDSVDGVMEEIDIAFIIINEELEEYFFDLEQKNISSVDAEALGRHLRAASNLIFNALMKYHLTVGNDSWRCVKPYLDGTERQRAALRTERAIDKCWEEEKKARNNPELEKRIRDLRIQFCKLSDEEAASKLEQLSQGAYV